MFYPYPRANGQYGELTNRQNTEELMQYEVKCADKKMMVVLSLESGYFGTSQTRRWRCDRLSHEFAAYKESNELVKSIYVIHQQPHKYLSVFILYDYDT